MLEFALTEGDVESFKVFLHGLSLVLTLEKPFFFDFWCFLSWWWQFFYRRYLFKGMAVLRYHALFLVAVDDCVQFRLKGSYLRYFCLLWAPIEQEFITVYVQKGKRFTDILLIGGAVDLLEFYQLFSFHDL